MRSQEELVLGPSAIGTLFRKGGRVRAAVQACAGLLHFLGDMQASED